jgi:hypothetical protein
MLRYPKPIEAIRHVETVQHGRGGLVTRITMRLDNGHAVRFHEVAIGGSVTICDSRADAFEVIRRQVPRRGVT